MTSGFFSSVAGQMLVVGVIASRDHICRLEVHLLNVNSTAPPRVLRRPMSRRRGRTATNQVQPITNK